MLSATQIERYSRQIILPQVGGRGQQALLSASVTICGSTELATTTAHYVAAAGIGFLRVPPSTALAIEGLNPDCHVVAGAWNDELPPATDAQPSTLGRSPAVLVSAGADADTCALMNATAITMRVPLIIGETAGALGRMSICAGFERDAPCYVCLSRQLGRTFSSDAAALGSVAAGFIGTLLATEVIKTVLRLRPNCVGRLVTFDARAGEVHESPVVKDPRCAVCGGLG
jgi:molybdopterin/thiamine biosynthesis adenylyltransferase